MMHDTRCYGRKTRAASKADERIRLGHQNERRHLHSCDEDDCDEEHLGAVKLVSSTPRKAVEPVWTYGGVEMLFVGVNQNSTSTLRFACNISEPQPEIQQSRRIPLKKRLCANH